MLVLLAAYSCSLGLADHELAADGAEEVPVRLPGVLEAHLRLVSLALLICGGHRCSGRVVLAEAAASFLGALTWATFRRIEELGEAAVVCQQVLELLELLALPRVLVLRPAPTRLLEVGVKGATGKPLSQVVDVLLEVSRDLLLGLAQRPELATMAVLPLQGLLQVGVIIVLFQQILKVLPHVGIDAGIWARASLKASSRGRTSAAQLLWLPVGSLSGWLLVVLIAIADEEMALVLGDLALALQLLVQLVSLLGVGLHIVLRRRAELGLL